MSAAQQAAALKDLTGCGRDGKGEPPSGPLGVIWLETPEGWRWRGGIYSYDLERGIRIGEPAGAPMAVPALLQTAYVVTPTELAPEVRLTMGGMSPGTLAYSTPRHIEPASPPAASPGPAPKAKPRKGRR